MLDEVSTVLYGFPHCESFVGCGDALKRDANTFLHNQNEFLLRWYPPFQSSTRHEANEKLGTNFDRQCSRSTFFLWINMKIFFPGLCQEGEPSRLDFLHDFVRPFQAQVHLERGALPRDGFLC